MTATYHAAYHAAYAFLRDYPSANYHAPSPREVHQALGLTKREYVSALRWLLTYHFLTRSSWDKRWTAVSVHVRHCACGLEITPANAVLTSRNQPKTYVRRKCRQCWRNQGAAESRLHRQRTNNNSYMKAWRLKRQLEKGVSP